MNVTQRPSAPRDATLEERPKPRKQGSFVSRRQGRAVPVRGIKALPETGEPNRAGAGAGAGTGTGTGTGAKPPQLYSVHEHVLAVQWPSRTYGFMLMGLYAYGSQVSCRA